MLSHSLSPSPSPSPSRSRSRSLSRFPSMGSSVIALALPLFLTAPLLADQIELETGEIFKGRILRHNEEEVSIRLEKGGVMSFKWATIRKAKKGSEVLGRKSEQIRPSERIPVKRKAPPPPLNPNPKPRGQPVQPLEPVQSVQPVQIVQPIVVVDDPPRPETQPSAGPSVQTVSPDEPQDVRREENLFTDEQRRFAMAPPEGFVRSPEQQSGAIPHAFTEPFTRSTLTVAAYPTTDSLVQVKKSALGSYTERYKVFRVTREEKLPRDKGNTCPEAWVIEIENKLGSIVVRQIQVFTKRDADVIVLTYSATLENFKKYEEAIGKSILSFRFLDPAPEAGAMQGAAEAPTGSQP